ncbi:nitrate ABC transporter permease [Roseomonas sp. PWR1]|uniref:Nitrate ABC transporter permease n=1 Tax=Roseomonas nitratireducens TaxID=2820810 RepID=A0ABS4AMX5_9PROT|nr:nitrate ABC transporter permease [Neoroseomonas nitratireducens]MBP0462715.1 nitrate ABC transporter permease [Neoroseomonas nitratireducens]
MNALSPPPAPAALAASAPAAPRAPTLTERLRPRVRHVLAVMLPPLMLLGFLLALWEWAAGGPAASLPPPSRVWSDAKELILNPFYDRGGLDKGLGLHLMASLQRVAVGFLLSAVIGVALGMLVGSSRFAMRALDPLFQVLRTVPPLAWLPLSLAAFREAQPSAIFVIFITAVWPIIINTAVGVRNVPADYRNVARVIRLSPFDWFLRIVVPAAAPYIFTGLRIGVGLSWLAIIAAEMLIGGVGIGFFVWDAWNSSNLSDIIVALVYIGLVGFALDRVMALVGRAVTRGTTEQ